MARRVWLLGLVLVGCGGGGSSPKTTDPARTLAAGTIVDLQGALANSRYGLWLNPFSRVLTGTSANLPPEVGNALGSVDGPPPTFYYQEDLGLWVNVTADEASYREEYTVDEARTQPAGHFYAHAVTEGEWTGETSSYEVLAGRHAGASGESTDVFRETGDYNTDYWQETYRAVAADGTVFAGDFTYQGLAIEGKGKTVHTDGKSDTFEAKFGADDAGRLTFHSGRGTWVSADFFADSVDAQGSLGGLPGGQPARFTLGVNGNMKIRFDDGAVVAYKGEWEPQDVRSRKPFFLRGKGGRRALPNRPTRP